MQIENTKIGVCFAYREVLVSLGCFPGGFWPAGGSRQLHSHRHHVDVEHLRGAGLPLQDVSARPGPGITDTFHLIPLSSALCCQPSLSLTKPTAKPTKLMSFFPFLFF